jgi:phosphate:Na+ symporter
MTLQIALNAAGGLALFLLAMAMMTEGLKVFAGGGLRRLLGRWTSTPLRGVCSGVLVTGVVQSSSAVTIATIGFVNAGVLTLQQALGVIFGTNVGTTITAWLVSLVGFGFKIESFALPILSAGVVLRLAAPGKRYQGLGEALAGFGLFFLGLAILKDAFGGLADAYGAVVAGGTGAGHWPTFVLAGFVATVLTQSSSAAIAIILTAASGGVVGIEAAAAAVIGANLGTTSTAAVAVLKATPGAKRLALGHIAFNLITGVVALALLPGVLWLVESLADWLDVEGSPAAILALFHTVFNVLGVALMLPFAGRLAALLERAFRSAEEDLARPQHLDATLVSTPDLAVAALRQELLRLRSIVAGIVREAVSGSTAPAPAIERASAAVRTVGAAVAAFVSEVRSETMPQDVADELARALRIARHLGEAARLAPRVGGLRRDAVRLAGVEAQAMVQKVLAAADDCGMLAERREDSGGADAERAAALDRFLETYQRTKAALLSAAVAQRLVVEAAEGLLDALSATRRLVEQLVKADRLLRSPARAGEIDAEAEWEANAGSPSASADAASQGTSQP